MIQVLKTEYFSKADAFILPLTGLSKDESFECRSYLFWREYSIENYQLILSFTYTDQLGFMEYCRTRMFPILDRKGYLMENYDIGDRSVFILDMSEWALDIEQFLSGKYSKFSKEAKYSIEKFHTFNKNQIPISIYAVLYPNTRMTLLREEGIDHTPIEYASKHYGLDLDDMRKIGEIGSKYNPLDETLLTDVDDLCQYDSYNL